MQYFVITGKIALKECKLHGIYHILKCIPTEKDKDNIIVISRELIK